MCLLFSLTSRFDRDRRGSPGLDRANRPNPAVCRDRSGARRAIGDCASAQSLLATAGKHPGGVRGDFFDHGGGRQRGSFPSKK